MMKCKVCGGNCDGGEMEKGICLDCRICIEEEGMRRRRAREVDRIMSNPLYQMKKKAELRRSEQRVPMFDLRAAERGV